MAKVTKVFMWLSIALGIAAALVPWGFYIVELERVARWKASTTQNETIPPDMPAVPDALVFDLSQDSSSNSSSSDTDDDITNDRKPLEGFELDTSADTPTNADITEVIVPTEPLTGWQAFWSESAVYVVASAIALPVGGAFPWLIYLILVGVKALTAAVKRDQDTRPRLLDVRQRIVVWAVALVLTVISFIQGIRFFYRRDSIWWLAIVPVFLIGAATFLHVMRRKE